jgi:hypothetical protein
LAGAASLMSPNPALVKAAGSADADIFVPSDPEEWRRRVENDLDDRDALRRRAETTRTHIITSNPLDRAAKVWREVLST